jgi:formyl-CoA transferase
MGPQPFFAPYEAYRTEDGYLVVVGTGGRDAWERLRHLGLERLLDDPRFTSNAERVKNAEELRGELEAVLATRPSGHWIETLGEAGIACAPVQRLPEVLESEQAQVLGMLGRLEHERAGRSPRCASLSLSRARSTSELPPPRLGDGTAYRSWP